MTLWPALDVRAVSDPDLVLAAVDDFQPAGAEERGDALRVFFASATARNAAAASLGSVATPIDVDDEDWARRSQLNLEPTTVGRITVVPDPVFLVQNPALPVSDSSTISIVIRPSMGFGTGHHATTRLCLKALQTIDLSGAVVLDVGTGSGILAVAAGRLGAACVLGLDVDPDAIQAAHENLRLNSSRNVQLAVVDLMAFPLPQVDVVVANLTGALIGRAAPSLWAAVKPGGTLIVSGILHDEEAAVRSVFADGKVRYHEQEGEWVCLTFNRGLSRLV